MTPNIPADIQKHINGVRRRMFGQELIRHSITAVVVAIVATIAWVLAEPFFWNAAPNWFRWTVLAGVGGLGLVAAFVLSMLRRPDATRSALWLDEAFGLRERVTTSLGLSPDDAATSAGQALLADASARVQSIKVRERFPIRVGWQGWLIPSAAGALALVIAFYNPVIAPVQGTVEEKKLSNADKADLEKKLAAIQRTAKREPVLNERGKSEDLKRLEAKLEEIAKQPRDNVQQLRERIKDLTPMEDAIKKLERERADKARMMQQQLQMKDALSPSDNTKDGPAADFQKSLGDGDLEKAKDELEKLSKKIANNELTEKDKEQLAKQLNNLQKKLNDLAKQSAKEDMLKKLAQDGKLDQEALERELKQLKQDSEKLKDLEKLADKMGQCQNCMKSGDMAGAQKALGEAAQQLDQTARDQGELDELRDQLESLRDAKDAISAALDELERPGGEGGGEGSSPMRGDRPSRGDYSDNNKGGVGSGRRSEGEQGKIRPYDARQNGKFDAKGKKVFDGFVPGQAFKKKSSMDIAGDIKQAAQEAPEAIENQRIPKAARDMAKGYFKNLGGQAEGEKGKEKSDGKDKDNGKAEKAKEKKDAPKQ